MLQKTLKTLTILAIAAYTAIGADAQTYRLPSAHTAEHNDLIARQENIGNQISVKDTQDFLDNLFKDEEEPELDIYTEGWNSRSVNAYAGMDVPDTKSIDVSKFAMPCPGYVTSPYGYRPRFRREHKGIDLKLQTGDTVYAAFDGRVRLTNFERRGYGNYVILRHPNGLETVYGHLSKFLIKEDQDVKAGEPIALGGNTGRSFGAHLHFETRFMGMPINPYCTYRYIYIRQTYLQESPQLRPRRQYGIRKAIQSHTSGSLHCVGLRHIIKKGFNLHCKKRGYTQPHRITQRSVCTTALQTERTYNKIKNKPWQKITPSLIFNQNKKL